MLLITDEESTEEIPSWLSDEEQVTHSQTAAVARVMHQDEGDVCVRVWDDGSVVRGGLAFTGALELESGVFKVSDALGESILRVPLGIGPTALEIYTDSTVEATHVDLVVTQTPSASEPRFLERSLMTRGTFSPGTKSGNFVPDHQPVSSLNDAGLPQQLFPQCLACSREQGLAVARLLQSRRK